MSPEDALYHAVHDYPGGTASLAPRMNLSPKTLQNMADPRQGTHPWSLQRFREVLTLANDMRPLQALCDENQGVFVRLPQGLASDEALLDLLMEHNAAFGAVCEEVRSALADDDVQPDELEAVRQRVMAEAAKGHEIVLRLGQLMKKPAA